MKILEFDRNQLMNYFKESYFQEKRNLKIAEIGAFEGSFAKVILDAFPDCHLSLVDLWQTENNDFYYSTRSGTVEQAYEVAKKRFAHLPNVKMCKGNSSDVSRDFQDESLDIVYIDADHSYQGALKDLVTWFPKVKHGGIISGHDWDANPSMPEYHMFGVEAALRNFVKDVECLKLTNESYHKSWYWVKP